ncbi:hypothetical protein HPB50_013878 [Hyalomma asiaticum]|uniref:Uncharacterized protein n=1 Tax=Hyalomma asiaticum TaxID=266040 RepID=A0ACB7RJ73_HYAAI|nr:hypothetical protein HPB50_013878 [Hyalomma asiaticum]
MRHSSDTCGQPNDIRATGAASSMSQLSGGRHKCAFCGKVFATQVHIHTGARPLHCHFVAWPTVRKDHLTGLKQKNASTRTRPFHCQLCPMMFKQQGHITQHLRVHNGDRPLQCRACQKGFTRKSTLTAHLHIHMGGKPYKCHLWNMAFPWRKSLADHQKSHRGTVATAPP